MLKKFIASFFAFLILTVGSMTYFAQAAHAQWYRQDLFEYISIVESGGPSELYGERYAAAQVRWIIYGLVYLITPPELACIIANRDNPTLWPTCGFQTLFGANDPQQNLANTPEDQGVLATFSQKSATVAYINSIGSRWHLVPEVRAQQGFGFETAGQVVLELWQAVRNVAYSLLIIVIIVMAFMIMFRVKLSPQTVITVQSALPKVVVTLVLITFSYAIAGLMIDLMYVVIGLLAAILREGNMVSQGDITWAQLFAELTNSNGAISLGIKYWLLAILALWYALISNPLGAIGLFGATEIIFVIVLIILTVVVFILIFRVWWMLLKNFVLIIFSIAFAPIQILFGTFSGNGFSSWAKNLAALLAVYPVVGFMYVLSFVFLRGAYTNWFTDLLPVIGDADIWPFDVADVFAGGNNWVPPLTGGAGDLDLVWMGASIAILALIPKASEMIKSFVSGRPFAYGSAIGEGLAYASVMGAAGWGMAKEQGLGRFGKYAYGQIQAGNDTGLKGLIYRFGAGQAIRQGVLNTPREPYANQVHRRSEILRTAKETPADAGGNNERPSR